jgi:uncharacterized protein involved in exopolysaccharide biosynthesis
MTDKSQIHSRVQDLEFNRYQTEDIDIVYLSLLMWRKKLLILSVFIISIFVSVLFISSITPRYVASSLILIKEDLEQYAPKDFFQFLGPTPESSAIILADIEILKSRDLAFQVIQKLNLYDDSELNLHSEEKIENSNLKNIIKPSFKNFSFNQTKFQTALPILLDPEVSKTIDEFSDRLRVVLVPGSLAVKISFISVDPYKAAAIVNTLVDIYSEKKINEQKVAQKQITEWLQDRLRVLQEQVTESEIKIQHFKNSNYLSGGRIPIISEEQLQELDAELIAAEQKRSEIQAKLGEVKNNSGISSSIGSQVGNINTNLIRNLRLEELDLNTDISELSNKYGPKHPKMIQKKSEMFALEKAIKREEEKIIRALEAELSVVNAKIKDIDKRIKEGSESIVGKSNALVKLQQLERDSDSSKLVLKTFLESFKRSLGRDNLQESKIKIISRAEPPVDPDLPNYAMLLSLCAFISLFLGITCALISNKFNSYAMTNRKLVED